MIAPIVATAPRSLRTPKGECVRERERKKARTRRQHLPHKNNSDAVDSALLLLCFAKSAYLFAALEHGFSFPHPQRRGLCGARALLRVAHLTVLVLDLRAKRRAQTRFKFKFLLARALLVVAVQCGSACLRLRGACETKKKKN